MIGGIVRIRLTSGPHGIYPFINGVFGIYINHYYDLGIKKDLFHFAFLDFLPFFMKERSYPQIKFNILL